ATTATNGRRCCPAMPFPCSRNAESSIGRRRKVIFTTFSNRAALPRPWSFLCASAAASRPSMHCCAIRASVKEANRSERAEKSQAAIHRRCRLPPLQGDGHHHHVPGGGKGFSRMCQL